MPCCALPLLVLAGGAEPVWARGLMVVLVGALLIASPRLWLPRVAWGCLAALLAWVLFSLVPLAGVGGEWRQAARSLGIEVPHSFSVQPLHTLEMLAFWACPALLLAWLLGNANTAHRRRSIAVVATGIGVLAVLVIIGNAAGWTYPFARSAQCFTLFPNRNQTSLLMVMGACLCWGWMLSGLRRQRLVSCALGTFGALLCAGAVVSLPSRAALALLLLGFVLQSALQLRGKRGRQWSLALPLALLACAGALFYGRPIYERAQQAVGIAGLQDYRVAVQRDALSMLAAEPLSVGLGNFAQVYPQFREESVSAQSIRHPESDYLWLATELGAPGLVLILGLGGCLLWSSLRRGGKRGAVEQAAGVACLLFLLSGFVDVPGHRYGTLLAAGLCFALWHGGSSAAPERRWSTWFARAAGIGLLVIGGAWLTTPVQTHLSSQTALAVLERGEASPAAVERWLPLAWQPKAEQAALALEDGNARAASGLFRQVRFLEPVSPALPEWEGWRWMSASYPDEALAAWNVMMQRAAQTGQAQTAFLNLYSSLERQPGMRNKVGPLARHDAASWLLHLRMLDRPGRLSELQRWATAGAPQPALTDADLAAALGLVARDFPEEVGLLIGRSDWPEAATAMARARVLAAEGRYADAVSMVLVEWSAAVPRDTEAGRGDTGLQVRLTTNPEDLSAGLSLLSRQMERGEWDAALVTIRLMERARQPVPQLPHWEAVVLHALGRDEQAWEVAETMID